MTQHAEKKVLVLGSTGSIGTSTLEVIRNLPQRLCVAGLSACSQWEVLAEQIMEFRPQAAALADETSREYLAERVAKAEVNLMFGPDGAYELVERTEADVVVSAITGWVGFRPTLRALELGRVLALANKETLVVGGEIVHDVLAARGGTILPVDSEQSAIFQAMCSGQREEVARVIVTASGGPFRGVPREELHEMTPRDALRHPTWTMGRKITIDSATMMNKALEVIEARWLFDLAPDQIDVLIHPQSVIHSLVEFVDGSVMAQLGVPDMKLPIQFALTWPQRVACPVERLNLAEVATLELSEPDPEEFPALALADEVLRTGGTSGAVLNAANEVAVDAFLDERIRFTEIVPLVADVLHRHEVTVHPDVDELERADRWARQEAKKCCIPS